jgi:dinuclear metal center YbgI/SA1388 family protein
MPTVAEVTAAIERRYPPSLAESWDSIGLVCGDPGAAVDRIHVAVDPAEVVVDEAIAAGAALLVAHHPLFLGGTDSVATSTSRGRLVHRLIRHDVALFVAHTNADIANPGVSDALAAQLGLTEVRALDPTSETGLGRIGKLVEPTDLRGFVELVARVLPATRWGIRAAGDPDRAVRTVAVAGGACAELAAPAAAQGADVLLTADLKHHRTSDAVADLGIGLVDAAHWATEQPWVIAEAAALAAEFGGTGTNVELTASTIDTDPWTLHAHSPEEP